MFTLDRKLWLTADKNAVVEDGDPQAAFLLGGAGTEITDGEAERLGLTSTAKTAPELEPVADEPVKAKKAPANKARKATPNKAK